MTNWRAIGVALTAVQIEVWSADGGAYRGVPGPASHPTALYNGMGTVYLP